MADRTTPGSPSLSDARGSRDDATLLIFATRYALGRRTFAPSIIKGLLIRHQDWLTPQDAAILIHDIEFQGTIGYGDPCDRETWETTLGWLREMLDRGLFRV